MSVQQKVDNTSLGTVQNAVEALTRCFQKTNLATPLLDARLIVRDVCGLSRENFLLNQNGWLTPDETTKIKQFLDRRLANEPISRIAGKREFWGHEFIISPFVLDPRPDTETLVETVLNILQAEGRMSERLRILDLGTGSGCILLSLLAELPNAWGVGTDISFEAISVATKNAFSLGVFERSAFICTNWCEAISGQFDLIVSNPPYIKREDIAGLRPEVRCYDPMIALDGGMDGFDAYRHIARASASLAKTGAWIVVEAGLGQADDIIKVFCDSGCVSVYEDTLMCQDLTGINRVVAIKRQTGLR